MRPISCSGDKNKGYRLDFQTGNYMCRNGEKFGRGVNHDHSTDHKTILSRGDGSQAYLALDWTAHCQPPLVSQNQRCLLEKKNRHFIRTGLGCSTWCGRIPAYWTIQNSATSRAFPDEDARTPQKVTFWCKKNDLQRSEDYPVLCQNTSSQWRRQLALWADSETQRTGPLISASTLAPYGI